MGIWMIELRLDNHMRQVTTDQPTKDAAIAKALDEDRILSEQNHTPRYKITTVQRLDKPQRKGLSAWLNDNLKRK